jgi:hypothetical protein
MNRIHVAVAAALALGVTLVTVLPAAAAGTPPAGTTPTWSVQASGASGSDGRLSFAYGVNPGTEIDDYVSVSNLGATPQTFSVYGTDAITLRDNGAFSLLTAAQKPKDVGAWITTKTNSISVAPGQTAIIPFVILVPSDATPGDHTGGVIASVATAAVGKKGSPGLGVDQRVAARVYLRVSGQPVSHVIATGLVTGFTPAWNPFGSGQATVDYDVKNSGNVREDVAQSVALSGPFGIRLATLKAKPVVNLLPGYSTHVHLTVPAVFPLLLLFADVKLVPSAPTDLVGQSKLRDQAGNPVAKLPEPTFTAITASAFTAAVSWTLLLIELLLIGLVWLVSRYVRSTRERMFDAIDAATEQARREALGQAAAGQQKETAGVSGSKS